VALLDSVTQSCPACHEKIHDDREICRCGYHFCKKEIQDWELAREYLAHFTKEKWIEKIQFMKNVADIQKKRSGHSPNRTRENLNQPAGTFYEYIEIAGTIDQSPELRACINITRARAVWSEKKHDHGFRRQSFEDERALNNFLQKNWSTTNLADSWELRGSEFPTSSGSKKIDLLAHHKTDKKWLVIELKVNKASDEAVGQLLRYMGWVKLNLAAGCDDEEIVEGLIITHRIDEDLLCSLVYSKDIKVQEYKLQDSEFYLQGIDDKWLIEVLAKGKIIDPSKVLRGNPSATISKLILAIK